MLHKVSGSYTQIAKHIPELKGLVSSSEHKKQQLLEMAERGEPRPSSKTKLGEAFFRYTRKEDCFDAEFAKHLMKLAPNWFVSIEEVVERKKQQLMEMAKAGKPRPKSTTKMGSALCTYTVASQEPYDPEFTRKIKKVAPLWFVSEIRSMRKRKLLRIAQKGAPKPSAHKTKIGLWLWNYTSKNSKQYDPQFEKSVRKLAPHWLTTKSEIAAQKKKTLLDMAKRGEPRPNTMNEKIGASLTSYTNPKSRSYDPAFDKKIRKAAPQWFVSKSQVANLKKEKLLDMARRAKSKPHHKTKIGSALIHYTLKKSSSYDPKFDREIRKIRPDWFVSQFDAANQKKKELLKMAKGGKPRPVYGKHPLGTVLQFYTGKSSTCYDPVFDKQIRKLAPHWFKRKCSTR